MGIKERLDRAAVAYGKVWAQWVLVGMSVVFVVGTVVDLITGEWEEMLWLWAFCAVPGIWAVILLRILKWYEQR